MFEVLGFYFGIVGKVFNVYLSYEIFPGVSYLAFICAAIIMTVLLSFIFHNIKEEYDHKLTLSIRARRANELSTERKYRREKYGE